MKIKITSLPKTKFIVENYLKPTNDRNASMDSMILALYMQVSRFLCWNRVQVKGKKGYEFPMIYGFNFAESGAYKDEVINSLVKVIGEPLYKQKEMKNRNYEARLNYYYKQLENMKGDQKKDYINEHKPKKFKNNYSKGSVVALQRHRKAAQDAKIGYVHYSNDEFVDQYGIKDSNADQIFSMAKSAYQKGDTTSSTIIGEWRDDVEGVPFTMFLHSSASSLIKNEKLLKQFLSILNTGIGKRSFILFNNSHKRVTLTDEQVESDRKTVKENIDQIKRLFINLYEAIKPNEMVNKHLGEVNYVYKTIEMGEGLLSVMNTYQAICNEKAESIKNDTLKIEMYDRFWRAFRLATCIAALEHPENLKVTIDDYISASELTDSWGQQFVEFVEKDESLTLEELYDFILNNTKTSKTIIRKKISAKNTREINEAVNNLKLMCDERDMLFVENKGRGLARYYSIIKEPKHQETPNDDLEVRISVGESMKLTETSFKATDIRFERLYETTGGKVAYSPFVFSNDYRKSDNWIGNLDLLILDIDNDKGSELKVNEAHLKFSGFTHYICTTKSHQKEKKGKVTDRFRVIFPLVSVGKITKDQYKDIVSNLVEQYGISEYCDLPASSDVSRMYLPFEGQEYLYHESRVMNPLAFSYHKEEGEIKRPLSPHQSFKVNGKTIGLQEAIHMAQSKSKTIPCYAFCHEDKKASAFFDINRDGNFQYTCSSCGISQFYKL